MTIPVHIPDGLARQAADRGLDVEQYVKQILEEAAAQPVLPPSPRLTREEMAECLAGLSQFSSQIPDFPDSALTREFIYGDHD